MSVVFEFDYYPDCSVRVEGGSTFIQDEDGSPVAQLDLEVKEEREVYFLAKAFFLGRRYGVNQFRAAVNEAAAVLTKLKGL